MKALLVSMMMVSVLASCAAQSHQVARPVNVASVKHQIEDAMDGSRTVTAMGRTRADAAVVYTRDKSGARHEESWIRQGGSWKLASSTALASN